MAQCDDLGLHCGFFDAQHRAHDEAILNMNRVLASAAGISQQDRVLDAGCGIGGSAIWLARKIGARVTGEPAIAGNRAEEGRPVNSANYDLRAFSRLQQFRGLAQTGQPALVQDCHSIANKFHFRQHM